MNRSEQINELAAALAKAQGEIEGAVKDKNNPAFRSKYADLGAVWDAIRAPLAKNGLCVVQHPTRIDGGVEVETVLMHSSGQWMSSTLAVPAAKQDAHGLGSATTYARRFALSAVCGVSPVDDDGNAATGRQSPPEQPKQYPPDEDALEGAKVWVAQQSTLFDTLTNEEEVRAWNTKHTKALKKLEAASEALYEKVMLEYGRALDRCRRPAA
jgi:hypothetical protein